MFQKLPLVLALMVIRFWLGEVRRILIPMDMTNQGRVIRGVGSISRIGRQDLMVMEKRKAENPK